VITSDLSTNYYSNTVPQNISVNFTTNIAVQSLSLNGTELIPIGLNTYSGVISISSGSYYLTVKAIDFSGLETTQTFTIYGIYDINPPSITLNNIPGAIQNSHFLLTVNVYEPYLLSNELFIDGVSVFTTNQNYFNYDVQLPTDQTKNLTLISKDRCGNLAQKDFQIVRDNSPFRVDILTPTAQSVLSSYNVNITARANRALSVAKINGRTATIDPNQTDVRKTVPQPLDGDFPITVEVTDTTGAVTTKSIVVKVQTSTTPAWSYQECKAE
jgi:hypothetical protein